MEKFAKFLLAIFGSVASTSFFLYLFIPALRPESGAAAFWLGVLLFFMMLGGIEILGKLAGIKL